MFTSPLIRESKIVHPAETLQSSPTWFRSDVCLKCCVLACVVSLSAGLANGEDAPKPRENARRASVIKFPPSLTPEQLDPWLAIEPAAQPSIPTRPQQAENPETIQSDAGSAPPLIIPELIDRPGNIDDQNVAPIPTAPTDSVDSSSSQSLNTTIPIVPESSDGMPKQLASEPPATDDVPSTQAESSSPSVYDSAPRLVTHSENANPTTPDDSNNNTAGAWQTAWTQIFATVVGVFIAAGIFLTIRFATMKLFGVHMGVTFHFGSPGQTTTLASSDDESAVTVSFENQFEQTITTALPEQSDEPNENSEDIDPPDSPFRIRHAA